jgi:hypothetical protein
MSVHRPTRRFFFSALGRVILSGWFTVGFMDFLLADHLTSQVKVMFDVTYGICLYTTGAFLDPSGMGHRPLSHLACFFLFVDKHLFE